MFNQQDGAVVTANLVDQLAQLHFFGGVHAGSGLVQGHQLRVGGQSAGDFQAPLVAIAQGAGAVIGKLGQTHIVQQLHGAVADGLLFGLEAFGAQNGAQQA